MRILIIGRDGQLAWELRRSLACLGEVIAIDRRSEPASVDLSLSDSIRTAVRQIHPALIINAAAYTAVDKAEQEPELAHRINAIAPGVLAEEAQAIGAGIVHYSTDYVFSGAAGKPYREEETTAPQSFYGESKRLGEEAVTQAGVPHLILRTSWIYGIRGNNFLLTLLGLMRGRDSIGIVADQFGAPTWCRQVAECTALLIQQNKEGEHFRPGQNGGIYHVTCGGKTSWHGFAKKIHELALEYGLPTREAMQINGITSEEYPTAAKRPAYSVLSNNKLEKTFNLHLPNWQTALQLCMADYVCYHREQGDYGEPIVVE